ncbi:hypothetical protein [Paraglaciecola sp. 2405UD69-4]|uniref:hypothetical protein n=1 Tax=Paraglaciecola sp. 2405UD69-4 TaxID=3391836 RepID=UPI0039C98276
MTTGLILLSINIWGQFQTIRSEELVDLQTRFKNEKKITFEDALEQIQKAPKESNEEFTKRLTHVVSDSLVHIHWYREPDNSRFNQLVPIWENYFLYFMGRFSGIPEFEKYHYTDYRRSIKRGIGICGDASIVMSQILSDNNIENKIISFPEHVVVAAQISSQEALIYDPDYGVVLQRSLSEIRAQPEIIKDLYLKAGHRIEDAALLQQLYDSPSKEWDGPQHFMTKKYYFERVSYALKWPLPIVFIFIGLLIIKRKT